MELQGGILGIPWLVWGFLALAVALVFALVWPSRNIASGRTGMGLRFLILRWAHAVVWLLLALSCFVRAGETLGGAGMVGMANILALLALVVYVAFMATLLAANR